MMNFKNLPLRLKIFLVSLCTVVFLLISYFFNFNQQQKRSILSARSANNAQLMRYHLTADMMHDAVRADCYTMIYVDGAEEYELAALNLKLHLSILQQNFALAQKQSPLPEIAKAIEKANINMQRYKAIALLISGERAQHLSANPKHFEQISTEFNRLFTSVESEMSTISAAIDDDNKNIWTEKAEQASHYNTMELTLLLIFLSIIALSLWLLQRTIIKPVEQMQRTIQSIEEGESVSYQEIQQSDEIGAMSSSLSGVVASLNNIKKLAEQISEVRDNSSSDFHIFNNKGEIHGALMYMKELLAQRGEQTASALKDAKEKNDEAIAINEELQKFFDLALDFMCLANVNGNFEKVNSMFSKALGYAPNELQGQAFAQYIHPDDLEATFKVVESLSTGALLINFTNRYRCKNGEYISLLWSAAPDISTGKLYATARDVTEQIENERILLQNNQELSTLRYALDQLAIVATTDVKGNITAVNDKFSEISKYSKEELLGKNHRILNSGHHPKEFFIDLWKTISNGEIWRNELCNRDKFGKLYWVDTIIVPIMNKDKKPEQYIAIRHDITARKKSEKLMYINLELQKEKDVAENSARVKSEFLANMSHEIRTPMNGVVGMIDLLEKTTSPTPQQLEYLHTIKSSSKTLLNIINDVLDLSKLEAGKMELRTENTNVIGLMNDIVQLYQSKADEKNIALVGSFGKNIPQNISTDGTRIKQVLSNFVSNAIKFTEHGEVNIHLEVLEQNGSEVTLKFAVSDSGIGIAKNDIKHLFGAFNQLDSSSSKIYEGTGLGLAISKKIVKLFNGEVGIDSEEGKGSTFWFTLKSNIAESIAQIEISATQNAQSDEKINLKVLLVDDKKVNLIVAKTMLLSFGCRVTTANDGIDAIEKFKIDKFDLVLMDIQMPKLDGVQATQQIKAEHSITPPIIALTANAMEGDKEKYLVQGFDDYLAKPIEMDGLRDMLLKWKK